MSDPTKTEENNEGKNEDNLQSGDDPENGNQGENNDTAETVRDNFVQRNVSPNMPPLQLVSNPPEIDPEPGSLPVPEAKPKSDSGVPEATFPDKDLLKEMTVDFEKQDLPKPTYVDADGQTGEEGRKTSMGIGKESEKQDQTAQQNQVPRSSQASQQSQAKRPSQARPSAQRSSRPSFSQTSDPLKYMFEDVQKRIEIQNAEINGYKAQLELVEAQAQTSDTRNEINNLKKQIDASLNTLNKYYKEARQIQEKDPEREWPTLAFATTLEEDRDDTSGLDYDVVMSHIKPIPPPKDELLLSVSPSCSQESLFNRPRIPRRARDCRGSKNQNISNVDCERRRLKEELMSRDRVVERLHKKVLKMQAELARLCKERQAQRFGSNINDGLNDECNDSILNTGADDDCAMFERINRRFENIKKDLMDEDSEEASDGFTDARNINFKRKYCELLEEYAKKDTRVQKLQAQLDCMSRKEKPEKNPVEDYLRSNLAEIKEENEAQKVIICEQSEQIEEYHARYLESLQKNEELKCIAKRLQMDNRKVEDQINLEIRQIKSKFDQKLTEYAQYPKLLENEQMKLAQVTDAKRELERKLRIVCLEFKKLRDDRDVQDDIAECSNCPKLQDELNNTVSQLNALRECYSAMTNRYDTAKADLDNLRKESAKVICRLKERADGQRLKLQSHIHKLEGNLAKARAAVSITSADKETTIKDMQGQLNCLATCLDSSQKQIKTLKDHIAYLNNGQTKSVVICCQADEKNL